MSKTTAKAQESELIEAYESLLETRPNDILLATRLGNLRLRLGGVSQVPKVIPLAERLRKSHGSNAHVKNLLAESAVYLLPQSHRDGSFDLRNYPANPPADLSQGMGQPRAVAQTAVRWKERKHRRYLSRRSWVEPDSGSKPSGCVGSCIEKDRASDRSGFPLSRCSPTRKQTRPTAASHSEWCAGRNCLCVVQRSGDSGIRERVAAER